jgi:hypothetical protein
MTPAQQLPSEAASPHIHPIQLQLDTRVKGGCGAAVAAEVPDTVCRHSQRRVKSDVRARIKTMIAKRNQAKEEKARAMHKAATCIQCATRFHMSRLQTAKRIYTTYAAGGERTRNPGCNSGREGGVGNGSDGSGTRCQANIPTAAEGTTTFITTTTSPATAAAPHPHPHPHPSPHYTKHPISVSVTGWEIVSLDKDNGKGKGRSPTSTTSGAVAVYHIVTTLVTSVTIKDDGSDDPTTAPTSTSHSSYHRYKEFLALYSNLRIFSLPITPLPPKQHSITSWFGSNHRNLIPEFLSHRAVQLQVWLEALVQQEAVLSIPAFRKFLELP